MTFEISTKKILAGVSGLFFVSLFCMPLFARAQTGQIPPSDSGSQTTNNTPTNSSTGLTYVCKAGTDKEGDCTWDDVLKAINYLVDWARNFALLFSVVVIAIAGGRYMISGDNPGQRKKANEMFVNVGWGIFWVLAAWLVVHLIVSTLLSQAATQAVPFSTF